MIWYTYNTSNLIRKIVYNIYIICILIVYKSLFDMFIDIMRLRYHLIVQTINHFYQISGMQRFDNKIKVQI